MNVLIQELYNRVEGLLYFSESEYPVMPVIIDVAHEKDISASIASYSNTDEKYIKIISARNFFARFKNYLAYGGPDEVMNNNAREFMVLHHFLKENFETTQVYRIERPGEAVIPIFIICKLKDNGGFAGLKTTSVET